MNQTVVLVGDVDHGKSSLLGRMACELGIATDQHIARLSKAEKPNYALILDALAEEQRDDRTVGLARLTLRSDEKVIRFLDAPGHKELLRSLVTGLSLADTVLFVVSAEDGVTEAFREQLSLLRLFSPLRYLLAITKSDLRRGRRAEIVSLIEADLAGQTVSDVHEVSSADGTGIRNLAEAIFALPEAPSKLYGLRSGTVVSVTGVLGGQVFGTLLSGRIQNGDQLTILGTGEAVTITIGEESGEVSEGSPFRFSTGGSLQRGDILVGATENFYPPVENVLIECCLFEELETHSDVTIRIGSRRYHAGDLSDLRQGIQKLQVNLRPSVSLPRVESPCFLNRAVIESNGKVVGVGVLGSPV